MPKLSKPHNNSPNHSHNQNYRLAMLVRLLAIGISSVGMLLLLPLVLHKLGEYDFGIWGMVSSITSYLLLLDFGIALACTRYLSMKAEDRTNRTLIISNALLLALLITGVLLLAALALGFINHAGVFSGKQQLISWVVLIVLLEVAISIPLRMYLSLLRTEVRYTEIGLFEVIRVVLRIGGIALALYLGADLLQIVMLAAAVNVLFFMLPLLSCYLRHRSSFISRSAINRETLKELLHFSKFTAVSQSAEFLKFRTDSVLVAALIGITTAAHYTIIVFIVMMLTQVLMRFMSYWDTIIIRQVGDNKPQEAQQTVFKSLRIGLSLSLLACLNLYLYGAYFIELWVGKQYVFLLDLLLLLATVLFSISFQLATTPYFNALKREKTNAAIDFAEVVLKFLLLLPMTLLLGFSGFILNTVIAASVCGIGLRVIALARYTGRPVTLLCQRILRDILPAMALVVLMLACYYFLLSITDLSPLSSLLIIAVLQLSMLAIFYFNPFKFKLLNRPSLTNS